jgi:pyruvate kinase
MSKVLRRTKIVATLGPASSSPEMVRQLIIAGMDVARLNFSHGSYEDHALTIAVLRAISRELDTSVTILQDLQGPKIRVGQLPGGELLLTEGERVDLVPEAEFDGRPAAIPIDHADAASDAEHGTTVLLADGLLELQVESVCGTALRTRVVKGGLLKSRKGVNFPGLDLRLSSLTAKDEQDLDFGIAQGVDFISLSFVRSALDVRLLKERIASKGVQKPVIAKIEKPQAVANLEEILAERTGIMVARGDLGVEMSAEKVPMLQKHIIEECNRRGLPVITATQMLESMIQEPRPTRAEASDVANAIIDGTDAVMLSGESAVGAYPVQAVKMMASIAIEVESRIEFKSYPAPARTESHAISKAVRALSETIHPKCIVVFTVTGSTALAIAAERLKTPVLAFTASAAVYHALNLLWGVRPLLIQETSSTVEGLVEIAASTLQDRGLAAAGEKILVVGGVPAGIPHGANFLKVHTMR